MILFINDLIRERQVGLENTSVHTSDLRDIGIYQIYAIVEWTYSWSFISDVDPTLPLNLEEANPVVYFLQPFPEEIFC